MNIRMALPVERAVLFSLDHAQTRSAQWSAQDWQAELAQPAAHVWCALMDEKIVGFVCVRGAADQYEITNLAVEPGHTRQGIGRALVQHVFNMLRACGAEQLTLEVSTANVPARALYESCGLSAWGMRKRFYKDGTDALIMGKKL